MHELPKHDTHDEEESPDMVTEGQQKRLWSWLFLCDDSMALSFFERTVVS